MACRVVVIKRFNYRGNVAEEWSNEYTFTGSTPADAAAWRTLFDALVVQEKTIYPAGTEVIGGYGYDSESPTAHAVWSVDLRVSPNTPVAGTLTVDTNDRTAPGDCAVWVRWKLNRNNSRGKPVYLRKYYHGAMLKSNAVTDGQDIVSTNQQTALGNMGGKMQDGTFLDGRTLKAAGHSDTIINHGISTFVTTRTLKRRGKRPS